MKKLTILILVLSTALFVGCGSKNDNNSETAKKTKPRMDLITAVATGHIDAVKKHIEFGTDLNMREPQHQSTALITAVAMGKKDIAKLLIDGKANLNQKNKDGSTALHVSAVFGKPEIAHMLIEAGADLNIQNNDGSTALHTAAFFCEEAIVKELLEKGADKTLLNKMMATAQQTVEAPFEQVKDIYIGIGAGLMPLGYKLDLKKIEETRPKIYQMLR